MILPFRRWTVAAITAAHSDSYRMLGYSPRKMLRVEEIQKPSRSLALLRLET
jgi:hypothetical protein